MLETGQSSIPLLFNSPLIDAEPGDKPGGLEDVNHNKPNRAEDAEGLQGRQHLDIVVIILTSPIPKSKTNFKSRINVILVSSSNPFFTLFDLALGGLLERFQMQDFKGIVIGHSP